MSQNQGADTAPAPRQGLIAYFKTLFSGAPADENLRDRVRDAVAEHNASSGRAAFSPDELRMLFNILEYGELRVDDVAVPRADIVAADMALDLDEMVALILKASYSRMPVYRGSLDEIVGLVHVKDLLKALATSRGDQPFRLESVMRPILFVPPSMRVLDLLAKMRRQRMHLAIVVDEYGGTDGLVSIEDLLEQIVGDIEDEHDDVDSEPDMTQISKGCYLADARLEIEVLEKRLERAFFDAGDDDDVDTLGGLVFTLAGEVPQIGDIIRHDNGVAFEVVDADPRRISKVRIWVDQPEPDTAATDTAGSDTAAAAGEPHNRPDPRARD